MEKIISEVHSLLIEFEKSIKRNKQPIVGASSTPQVLAIQGGRVQKYKPQGKAKGKGKGKGKSPQNSYPTKPKKPQPYKKERPDYALESAARILNMVLTKKVDKTPYKLWHGKVSNLSYLKESGRIVELEDEDILPSENTSEYPIEKESLAPIRLIQIDYASNVEVKEHSLRDLNEPANYKAALSDPEFEKWLVAMNTEMQSMFDNKV
nr:hypothetical protein [Tanacetum cinerariifolium]